MGKTDIRGKSDISDKADKCDKSDISLPLRGKTAPCYDECQGYDYNDFPQNRYVVSHNKLCCAPQQIGFVASDNKLCCLTQHINRYHPVT
jgi:hypothetical protein